MMRFATERDIDKLYSAWQENSKIAGTPDRRELIKGIPRKQWILFSNKGNDCGFAMVEKIDNEMHISHIYVDNIENNGKFIEELITDLKKKGKAVHALSETSSPYNKYYEKCGLEKIKEKKKDGKVYNWYRFEEEFELDLKKLASLRLKDCY